MAKAIKNAARTNSKAQKSAKASKVNQNASQNPYRPNGGYWSAVEALRTLGLGKMHSDKAIIAAYRKAMGANWKEFAAKDGCEMNAEKRALVNVMVTSRIKDYGKPLIKLGFQVKWNGRDRNAIAGLYKLGKK